MAFLEVKNICKSFGETAVLKGVSFDMDRGEVFSIIGSSGNGKTTLLRCLNFLETADEGTITVDGVQIFPDNSDEQSGKNNDLGKNSSTFGMVFQSFPYLFGTVSVPCSWRVLLSRVGPCVAIVEINHELHSQGFGPQCLIEYIVLAAPSVRRVDPYT